MGLHNLIHSAALHCNFNTIPGFHPLLQESKDKEGVAMLDEQTINANEKSFVEVHPKWLS